METTVRQKRKKEEEEQDVEKSSHGSFTQKPETTPLLFPLSLISTPSLPLSLQFPFHSAPLLLVTTATGEGAEKKKKTR